MKRKPLSPARRFLLLPLISLQLLAQGFEPGSLTDPPAVDTIQRFRLSEARATLAFLDAEHLDPDAAIRTLEKRSEKLPLVSILSEGLLLAQDAALVGRVAGEPRWTRFAVALADTLYRRYVLPSGAFIERDRAQWIEPTRGWRTIPWGVPFRGHEIMDTWQMLQRELSAEQASWWRTQLLKLGAWIHRNPVLGSVVFNASIDMCRLQWRLGKEFDKPEWQQWALETAHFRIRKDIDEEGWIHSESGGVSGIYQMIGAEYLANFSVEANDPIIDDATRRVFRGALAYAAPDLSWNGNFGTRSAGISVIPPQLILAAARLGEPEAVHLTRRFGQLSWSASTALWKAALSHPAKPPVYPAIHEMKGIQTTIVREGPWVLYLSNYTKSQWVRGFSGLWHSGFNDWIFSGLHSLPTKDASVNLKMRINETDTSDWAGLPHIRVNGPAGSHFDSHQKMERLAVSGGPGRVVAQWSEPLLDRNGQAGGKCDFRLTAVGETLELSLHAANLAGPATVDFHVLHRPQSSAALWAGKEAERIAAGSLPETGGMGAYEGTTYPDPPSRFAIQIDNAVLGFEVIERPGDARAILGMVRDDGLHSSNLGGLRLRFESPSQRDFKLSLRIRKLNGK